MTSRAATFTGFLAILLWSTLALFTAMSGPIPPFQTVAMTFAIGGVFILTVTALRGRLHLARPTPGSLALGVIGPFGDTALYFAALKLSPPAEANLIHYLWPLLIVLFAALLPGGRLLPRHLIGAGIGLIATALIVLGREGTAGGASPLLGYALAALGAVVWAAYSVLSRRFAAVPTESLGISVLACTIPAILCHLAFETTIWPGNLTEWAGIIGLGIGSIGAAFIVWDIGMKQGDVAFLGVASYAAPVLSTLVLIGTGHATGSWIIALSCLLIVAGAGVASADQIAAAFRRR
jgi:drug/metabolite transporter (DMT)-like permease